MRPPACFVSIEIVDRVALETIIHNLHNPLFKEKWTAPESKDGHNYDPYRLLMTYHEQCVMVDNTTATRKVEYCFSKRASTFGRRFATHSLQCMARPIRHTLAHKVYDDIDIKNAHPTLCVQICEELSIPCEYIKAYIQNRDCFLDEIAKDNQVSKDKAKEVVLSILNGGQQAYRDLTNKPQWLKAMMQNVHAVHIALMAHDRCVKYTAIVPADKHNREGSVFNLLMCDIENKIISTCCDFITFKGWSLDNIVLVFDGFMVPKAQMTFNSEVLRELEAFVRQKTGYSVEFARKPMSEVIDLTGFTTPVPAAKPLFSPEAVTYIVRTEFGSRHHTTVVTEGDAKPVLVQKEPLSGDDVSHAKTKLGNLVAVVVKKGVKKRRRDAPEEDDVEEGGGGEASYEERFSQTFKWSGTYCEHYGGVHTQSTTMEVKLRWFWPAGKAVQYGDKLPTTVSLQCTDPRCSGLKPPTMRMLEEAEHYVAYRAEFEKSHFKVRHPLAYGVDTEEAIDLINKQELVALEANTPHFSGLPFTLKWTTDPGILSYEKVDLLPPPRTTPVGTYNMWRGFTASRIKKPDEPIDVSMFITLVADVFETNQVYVTKYCAHMIQKPGEKTGINLTVIGCEGVGKGMVFENTMAEIMGDIYCAYTCDPSQLVAKHSELKNGKILVLCDDFKRDKMHKIANEMKSNITARKTVYEKKHIQSVQLSNYANYVNLTNDDDPIDFSGEARRHVVVRASSKLMGNLAYFKAYNDWITLQMNQRATYDYLMEYDISDFNPTRDKPITELHKALKFLHLDPVLHFLHYKLCEWVNRVYEQARPSNVANDPCATPERLCASMEDGKAAAVTEFFKTGFKEENAKTLHGEYSVKWWEGMKYGEKKEPLNWPRFGQFLAGKVGEAGGFTNVKDDGHRGLNMYNFDIKHLAAFLQAKGFDSTVGHTTRPPAVT